MSRKTALVSISAEGRDHGKTFVLTEMPAHQAEKWAYRAILALTKTGLDIPDDVRRDGMAGIARLGLDALGRIRFNDRDDPSLSAESLLDEMFTCVRIRPSDNNPDFLRNLVDNDIEEVATRVKLRGEVFSLHVGFSIADASSKLSLALAMATEMTSKNTKTSHRRSARSSRRK